MDEIHICEKCVDDIRNRRSIDCSVFFIELCEFLLLYGKEPCMPFAEDKKLQMEYIYFLEKDGYVVTHEYGENESLILKVNIVTKLHMETGDIFMCHSPFEHEAFPERNENPPGSFPGVNQEI